MENHFFLKAMDGIDISRPGLVTQVYIHQDLFHTLGHRYLKGLFFGGKRLNAGIPDQAEFFVRTEHHDAVPAVGGLGHIDFRNLE